MPINYTILQQGRVFIETFEEPFTVTEVAEAMEFCKQQILDKATEKVINISDFSSVTRVPPNMLSSALTMSKKPHPMAGPVILVVKNRFINDLANILGRAVPKVKFIVCPTLEQALEEADQLIQKEKS